MKFAAKLLLENGISFEGIGFGFKKIGVGEVVFNTAITGYQEILKHLRAQPLFTVTFEFGLNLSGKKSEIFPFFTEDSADTLR